MAVSSMKDLLEAGVHFGHHTRKWNPKMKPYIFGARNDIYIIDLHKTRKKLEEAYETVRQMAFNGNTFLFVGTKKQAQEAVKEAAQSCEQYYVNSRWLGGMLTNWQTMQTRIDRLNQIDKMAEDGTLEKLPKKEVAQLTEERNKLDAVLGGIRTLNQLPDCIFIIDCKKEHIAIKEARRLEIPIVAVVDTNCDPDEVDHAIPGNDDAIRAVRLMAMQMAEAINEGRGLAQSAQEQIASAAMAGAASGAVHIGEGGRIEYVGAPQIELPPVDTGDEGEFDEAFGATDKAELNGNVEANGGAEASGNAHANGNAVTSENAEDADGDSPMVANEETPAVEAAASPGMTEAPTSEESEEEKSVRSEEAQTPADGTLG